MTTIVLTSLLALLVATAGNGHPYLERPAWIDRFAWAVAVCETAKRHHPHPDFEHRSGSYGGAWGWYVGTWQLDRATKTWRDKTTGKWKGYPDDLLHGRYGLWPMPTRAAWKRA